MRRRVLCGLLAVLAATGLQAQTTYYVNGSCGDDAWSGLSPVCQAPDGPKKTISSAAGIAGPGVTVLVAPGAYNLEENAFGIYVPVTIRSSGGPFVTTIDGAESDRNIPVFGFDGGPGVIDGFTFTRIDTLNFGFAPISVAFADLMLVNCRFIDNRGFYSGVVWMDEGDNTVTAINCVFERNSGAAVGGIAAAHIEVVGCTFIDNIGIGNGANCLIAAESIQVAGSIFLGEPQFVYGDGPVTYCNVQGGLAGEGNIDADPLFADPAAGDYRLAAGSPCIDAGSNPAVPEWLRTDIAGLERFIDDPVTPDTGLGSAPLVDMGAHEFQPPCYPDFTADGVLDLFDFLAFVNAFNAADPAADCDHNAVLDLFDFLCFVNAFNQGC